MLYGFARFTQPVDLLMMAVVLFSIHYYVMYFQVTGFHDAIIPEIQTSKEGDKYCVLSPTYPAHFSMARRLLQSIKLNAGDLALIDIFFVIDKNSERETFHSLLRSVMSFQAYSFEEILNYYNEGTHQNASYLGLPIERDTPQTRLKVYSDGNLKPFGETMNAARRYQAAKKYYGLRYLLDVHLCTRVWVMDSESLAFRNFTFEDIFKPNVIQTHRKLNEQALKTCQNVQTKAQDAMSVVNASAPISVEEYLSFNLGISLSYLNALQEAGCPTSCYSHDDFWIYDTRSFKDMVTRLETVHYPVKLSNHVVSYPGGWTGEYLLYCSWILINKYNPHSTGFYRDVQIDSFGEGEDLDFLSKENLQVVQGVTSTSTSILNSLKGKLDDSEKRALFAKLREKNWRVCRGWGPNCFDFIEYYLPDWQVAWCLSNCDM